MVDHEKCRELLGSLSDYINGDLGDELCHVIEHHMAECENCRIVVDTLQKTIYLYQNASESEQVPADVKHRLYRRLNLEDFLDM